MEKKKKKVIITALVIILIVGASLSVGIFAAIKLNPNLGNGGNNPYNPIPVNVKLTINAVGNGTTSPVPGEYQRKKDETTVLIAQPYPGSMFDHWAGNIKGGTAKERILFLNMSYDADVTAYFRTIPITNYTLSINVDGQGTVIPGVGDHLYAAGTLLNLTAVESVPGWKFQCWTGPINSTEKTVSTFVFEDMNFTAHFTNRCSLTIIIDGEGITNLGGSGTYEFIYSTEITLAAIPLYGYRFDHFSGDISSSANPVTTVIDGDKTVTVHFVPIPKYTLTIKTYGGGITAPPAGTYYDILKGTTMTLSAIDFMGAKFQYWGVNGRAYFDRTITITIDSNTKAEAFFSMV